jgi:VTC domain
LIKERTSGKGTTSPVSIPGQGNADEALAQLESELFSILGIQHERVNLFTRSKYGEFERHLDYIDHQARLLTRQKTESSSQPIRNTRRYAKLVRDLESVGEEVQSLSRYVATQKQAFRKILKKYRKWTGSSGLELRLNNETFNQPGSALNLDFMPLLDHSARVNSTLTALSNSPIDAGGQSLQQPRKVSATAPQKPRPTASRLHDVFVHSSPSEFDAAFLAVPLGMAGGRASYWIHDDNLEEVIVLLRRFMKERNAFILPSNTSNTSLPSFPTARHDSAQSGISKGRMHISMFDNLQRFIKAHGAVTVGQAEDLVGSVSSILAMIILWTSEPEAVVVSSDLSPATASIERHMDVSHVRRKDLIRLFEPEGSPSASRKKGSTGNKPSASDVSLQVHRDWLAQNRDIKPLAEVECTRSRFAGLNNTNEVGTWAVLDSDIIMSSIDQLKIGSSASREGVDVQRFPHTVLEVRWEFSRTPEIVRALDSTHLVERIRGFSLEAQAIGTVCKPSNMPPPMWQPWLERDIRKVPPVQARINRRKSIPTASSSEPSHTEDPSTFSAGAVKSSGTSAQDSSRSTAPTSPIFAKQEATDIPRLPNRRPPKRKSHPERQVIQRYWNEFDDGDETPEDQRYTIYVNPDEHPAIPGAETVGKAFSSLYQSLGRAKGRIVSWLPMHSPNHESDQGVEEGVRRPLLGVRIRHDASDNDDSSDTDTQLRRAKISKRPRSALSSYPSNARRKSLPRSRRTGRRHHVHPSHETALFRTYVGCYGIAFVLLIMSAILKATGRHRARVEVDAGIVVGVIGALGSAIIGISLMMSREEKLSWMHWALGVSACLVICAGSGWLLATVGVNL